MVRDTSEKTWPQILWLSAGNGHPSSQGNQVCQMYPLLGDPFVASLYKLTESSRELYSLKPIHVRRSQGWGD